MMCFLNAQIIFYIKLSGADMVRYVNIYMFVDLRDNNDPGALEEQRLWNYIWICIMLLWLYNHDNLLSSKGI